MAKPDRVPEEKLRLYQAVIDAAAKTHPEIILKGGKKLPFTSTNGYMYSSLSKDGRVGLRLPEDAREAFMSKYGAIPFKNYGANIREHVEVPAELLRRTEEMARYLASSFEFTKGKPKKK